VGGTKLIYSSITTYILDIMIRPVLKDHRTVRTIKNANRADESLGYIIYGNRGTGKTVYSCVIGSQVVGTMEEPEWGEPLRKWIKFTPREFSELVRTTKHNQIWFDWDDAGYWLNRMFWNESFVRESLRYMTIQRTQFTAIMFSTPNLQMLPKKILEMEDVFRVRISKAESNLNCNITINRPRIALLTQPWHSDYNSKAGCKFLYEEKFNGLFPDDFFEWYQPMRKKYLLMASKNITDALKRSKGQAMTMQLEDVEEELMQRILPNADETRDFAETLDSLASYAEQEKIDADRKEEKRKRKPISEEVAALAIGKLKRDINYSDGD